ncbi:hypothetical protein [Vibrio phage vB_VpaP_SJSY21]|nr:hypothetical protein [Vibrio phage vB_VpaP_SJSY21]
MDSVKVTVDQYKYIERLVVAYMATAVAEDDLGLGNFKKSLSLLDKKFDEFFEVI